MSAAITIAETGHLVLGTLHTNTAAGAITRLVDAFPPDKKDVIRMNLSMSILAVVSQQLVPTKEGKRVLACEILIATPAIRALIREDNIHQIDNYIKSGKKDGMIKSIPNEYLIPDTSQRVLNLIVGTANLSNMWVGIR